MNVLSSSMPPWIQLSYDEQEELGSTLLAMLKIVGIARDYASARGKSGVRKERR
jgi:hypothetical protein